MLETAADTLCFFFNSQKHQMQFQTLDVWRIQEGQMKGTSGSFTACCCHSFSMILRQQCCNLFSLPRKGVLFLKKKRSQKITVCLVKEEMISRGPFQPLSFCDILLIHPFKNLLVPNPTASPQPPPIFCDKLIVQGFRLKTLCFSIFQQVYF